MSTILLVVDDEPDVQFLVKQKFRKQIRDEEYEFLFASNGLEAIEVLKEHPEIEVILCDVNMPQMDGISLLSKTKALNSTAQTIIVSAYGDMRNIRRAMNHGAFDFVTKPINFNDLGATINKTIQHVTQLKTAIEEKKNLFEQLKQYNRTLEERVDKRTAEIQEQSNIIQAKNQSITESINYAKRIQQAALPRFHEIKGTFANSFVLYKPRDIVSGDFYWFAEKDGKSVITAVDCTGHGVPGAFMSLIGNDLLHSIVEIQGVTSPDEILSLLHLGIQKALRQDESNNRDGMDLAICVVDIENKTMEFAGARNPLIYIKNGELTLLKGDRKTVGGLQKELTLEFTKKTISIEEPTMYYIFSDGYQDQFGGENRQKFMAKKFRNLLLDIHEKNLEEQQEILEKRLSDWMGDSRQIDDILVIGFKI
jgi:CheY-like chemotaxis protein